MKQSFLIFLILLCINGYCQDGLYSIRGTVTDSTGNTLQASTIVLKNTEGKIVYTTITDLDGRFSIRNLVKGQYLLFAEYVGYTVRSIELNVNSDIENLILALQQNSKLLETVTVNVKKPLIERKIDRTVINLASLNSIQGGNAIDALRMAPGVKINQNSISISGKGEVLIMLDERLIRLNSDDLLSFLKSLPSDNIEKIEVITNPPSRYEASGNSGYINIITKKNYTRGYNGSLNATIGEARNGFASLAASMNYNIKKVGVNLSPSIGNNKYFSTSNQKIWLPKTFWDEYTENSSDNNNKGINTTVTYAILPSVRFLLFYNYSVFNGSTGKNNVSFFSDKITNKRDSTIETTGNMVNENTTSLIDFTNENTLIKDRLKANNNFSIFSLTKSNASDFSSESERETGKKRYLPTHNEGTQKNLIYIFSTDWTYSAKKFFINWGIRHSRISNKNNNFYSAKDQIIDVIDDSFAYKEYNNAIYLSAKQDISKWSYQCGIRVEHTENSGQSISTDKRHSDKYVKIFPTAYLSYKNSDKETYSASFGKRISRPGYHSLNPFRVYNNIFSYSEGNPYLQPYFSHNFELTHSFNDVFVTSLYANLTKNAFDQITLQHKNDEQYIQTTVFRNFLDTRSFGMNEDIYFNKIKWLESRNSISVYYSYIKPHSIYTQEVNNGWSGYLSSDNSFVLNKKKTLLISIGAWLQLPEASGIDNVRTYYSINSSFSYKPDNKKWNFSINANDIFKTANPSWTSMVNNSKQEYNQYSDSRRIRLSVSYKFERNRSEDNSHVNKNIEWNRAD